MRTTLLSAVLVSGLAGAAPVLPPLDAPTLDAVAQAPAPTPAAASDEDEDEDAPPKPGPTTGKPDEKKDDKGAPAGTATTAAPTAGPATPAVPMKLVSGAPLDNPNVGVHIVEMKQFSDSGQREVILYPLSLQVNGKFTQHIGAQMSFVWHLQENFGLQLTGGFNWYNVESAFNGELVNKVRAEAQAATSLLNTWSALGGVEASPLYGKFAFFEGTLAHFSIVLNGGAGLGGTRHQLKPESLRADGSTSMATYGDTGMRFMASLGAGFRLQLGQRFAFRIELRDVIYTARVEKVNGCDVNDLRAMDNALRQGKEPGTVAGNLSGGCNVTAFTGNYENSGEPPIKRSNDVPLALNLVRIPSSDVLNNVGLYLGASFLF